ncbi:MAG: LacI family transcriptional regulator [Alphaproteobacteria bacterium]|nr:MAG: LacI family transcriptional regulator [Alphaproteobacteria bacterium]
MSSKKSKSGEAAGLKMDDVARLAGVSKSTVSRALADSPLVNEETKKKIRALAARHNYTIDQRARNFRLRQTNAITVAIPLMHDTDQHVSDPFFLDLLGHIADALSERGYDLLLSKAIPQEDDWLEKLTATRRTDGLILMGQSTQHEAINRFARYYKRIVVWGAAIPGQRYTSVGSDNRGGAYAATRHLLSLGRRRIVFLGDRRLPEIGQRHAGYVAALEDAGLAASEDLLVTVHFSSEAAYRGMRAFLARGTAIDAVVASSDVIAMSAIRALRESGHDVPEDVAVVGYDDIGLAAYVEPPLTTVRQDTARAAVLLVESLLARIAGRPAPSSVIASTLVVRKSCGAATRSAVQALP